MPDCSIVIPVYNHASVTRQCLNALLENPPQDVECEIVVVDDASTDITPELLASYGSQITGIRHQQNRGFAHACNDGAAAASGELLVFLNNDILPRPGWLEALVRYARAHPAAAVVGSKLLYPDGTIQHAGVVICRSDRYPRHLYRGFPGEHPAVNVSRTLQVVTAACMSMDHEADQALAQDQENIKRALSAIGAWSDLDFDEMLDALDQVRHRSKPTPPIDRDL